MADRLISLISTDSFGACHGLRSISAYLKAHGYATSSYYMRTLHRVYSKPVLNDLRVRMSNSDLIGISCLSQNAEKATQVIESLKPLGIPIVWGGIHATLNPERCLESADIVCMGEGEGAALDLVESLDDKDKIKTIKNLWVKENGNIYRNELRPLISNLDELPLEDYDLEKQFVPEFSEHIVKFTPDRLEACNYAITVRSLGLRGIDVILSRGCPFSCFYCCSYDLHKLYGTENPRVRRKSVEAAISELVYRKQSMANFNFIVFNDEEFFGRPLEEIKEFSAAYKEKVNLPFGCYLHFSTFDEEKLKTLVDCGLRIITIGIQSGSSRINTEIFNRHMPDQTQCVEIAKQINRYQDKILPPFYQIITGNPYENEEDVWASIRFVRSLPKPFNLRVFQLAIFPGSSMAKKTIADGIVKNEEGLCYQTSYFNIFSHFGIKKNRVRYLWLVLSLLTGLHTQKRTGLVSERTFNILSNKRIASFFSKSKFGLFLGNIFKYLLLFKSYFLFYTSPWLLKRFCYSRLQKQKKSYRPFRSIIEPHALDNFYEYAEEDDGE